jgi:hypothetical protein
MKIKGVFILEKKKAVKAVAAIWFYQQAES